MIIISACCDQISIEQSYVLCLSILERDATRGWLPGPHIALQNLVLGPIIHAT